MLRRIGLAIAVLGILVAQAPAGAYSIHTYQWRCASFRVDGANNSFTDVRACVHENVSYIGIPPYNNYRELAADYLEVDVKIRDTLGRSELKRAVSLVEGTDLTVDVHPLLDNARVAALIPGDRGPIVVDLTFLASSPMYEPYPAGGVTPGEHTIGLGAGYAVFRPAVFTGSVSSGLGEQQFSAKAGWFDADGGASAWVPRSL